MELALSIDKHLPGYVDAYFGPEDIREIVDAKGKVQLEDLSSTLDQIIDSTHQDAILTKERREYLSAELKAMHTTLRILKGEEIGIVEETQGLYGLTPIWTEESVFDEAHQDLEYLLHGSGPLAERMESFREKIIVPKVNLKSIVRNIADDFRRRTVEVIALPEDENCEFSFVQDKSWLAYNWYLGKCLSRIDINIDLPWYAGFLPHVIAHETYPGHHTEHAVKEKELYREGGFLEHSIILSNAPSAVVSEGIAEIALEIIETPEEIAQILQSVLDQAGLKDVDGIQIYQISKAMRPLSKVSINRVLLLHSEGASDEEVINYGMRYILINEQFSRKGLEFLKDPLWRSYATLYPLGYELVQDFISRGEDKTERFLRLIRKPMTTSRLLARVT
ncbi:MAG: hypothetical protein E3J69_09625 [Anaerolineales bacterium]|nr:MAG: hypothetical protein E3J69_09625 [Anaerolineales bacterium]